MQYPPKTIYRLLQLMKMAFPVPKDQLETMFFQEAFLNGLKINDPSSEPIFVTILKVIAVILAVILVFILVFAMGALLFGVVGAKVLFVVIVAKIIDRMRRTGSFISGLASHDLERGSDQSPTPSNERAYPVIPDSVIKGATMDRFFGKLARERPIRFSRNQLETCTKGFVTNLGSGGYGVVYKGVFPDGFQVAVKLLRNKGDGDRKVQEQFMAELGTLGRTYHKNLVRLCGFCFDTNMKALVYEFMERGSLNKILFTDDIDREKLYEIAIGIAKGIAYLHEDCHPSIIHYDIKPGNVLLDKDLNPKVADFGLAKLCHPESAQSKVGFRGTEMYAAPEFWSMSAVTHKCDVYSFGIMLFEILGRKNFDEGVCWTKDYIKRWTKEMFQISGLSELLLLFDIQEKNREKAERISKVALWCIQDVPELRPKMSDVVKMLEGGMEITMPTYPFQRSYSPGSASTSNSV